MGLNSVQSGGRVNYDIGESTVTQNNTQQAAQAFGQIAAAATGGALSIATGGLTDNQTAYLNKMQEIQDQGAALQSSMFVIQQRAQNDALVYQGMSNASKTAHDTQINTVRNVRT
jgi:hypothetical protein